MVPSIAATTTTTTATTSTICSSITSGRNSTEIVYSQVSNPRITAVIQNGPDSMTAVDLHHHFAPFYQHRLLSEQNRSCCTWSSDPLPIHSACCADKHCQQMRQHAPRLHTDMLTYHHNVATWAMRTSVRKEYNNNGPMDLTATSCLKKSNNLTPESCSVGYTRGLMTTNQVKGQALDLSAH